MTGIKGSIATAAAWALVACVAFVGAASAQTTLRITRATEAPGAYAPGETVDIRVTFIRQGGGTQVTQLGLSETLPSGWSFEGLVSGAVPQIPPANGARGQLNFGWIQIPSTFPASFVYRVRAGVSSSGTKPIAGRAVYALVGGSTTFSSNVVTLISQQEGTVAEGEEEGEGEGAVGGSTNVSVARAIAGGDTYEPGKPLDVTITLTKSNEVQLTQLGFIENIPPGWAFDKVVSGAIPGIQPTTGKTDQLSFAWIFIPTFPVSFTYRLQVPQGSTGDQLLRGLAVYSTGGAQEFTPQNATTVSEGTVSEEGEGGDADCLGGSDPSDSVVLSRVALNNGFYTPGQAVSIRLTLDYTGVEPVQVVAAEELAPPGWTFGGFQGGNVPPIAPQPGTTGTLGFAYITPPSFPATFTYQLFANNNSVGEQTIIGRTRYAFGETQCQGQLVSTVMQSTFEGGLEPGLTMRRLASADEYVPGALMDVTVNLTFVGTDQITTLGFEETLPPNWTFLSVQSANPPPVAPESGEQGAIAFAWIDPPVMPVAVTYRVQVANDSTGQQQIAGRARYATTGNELTSNQETTTFEAADVAEGEGGDEGEGGGIEDEMIKMERTITSGLGYAPGDIVDIRLTITQHQPGTPLAFAIQEVLPEGFAFDRVLDATLPPIRPATGTRGEINFAYISAPALPMNLNYRIVADPDATGDKTITGRVEYRLQGPPLQSNEAVTIVPQVTPADLVVQGMDVPDTLYTGRTFPFVATILNQGQNGVAPPINDCLYLSTDNVFGGDTQIACFTREERIAPSSLYYLQERLDVPGVTPGDYFLFVQTDDGDASEEANENNNVSAAVPVTIEAVNYSVIASHQIRVVEGQGTIVLRGSTNDFVFGAPVPNAPVAVDLTLHGVTRVFTATTNNFGQFEIPFTPLPTEAGRYSVAGRHPGLDSPAPEQDSFTLNLMRIDYEGAIVSLAPNVSQTVVATVENLGDTDLTSVGVAVQDVPAGITAQASIVPSIAGGQKANLTINLVVEDAPGASGVMRVVVANAQNVNSTLFLPFQVLDGVPNFTVTPEEPNAGAIPGEQALYEFELSNIGGGTALGFQVEQPEVPWVNVVAPAAPTNLRAQDTLRIILQLAPPASQPLGDISTELALLFGEEQTRVTLPLTISVVGQDRGGVDIVVTDETMLTTTPEFRVQNVNVLLRDPETQEVVIDRTTTASGSAQFRNIPSGAYNIEAHADGYGAFRDVVVVDPGAIAAYPILLQRNFTSQEWVVEPTLAFNAPNFISNTEVQAGAPGPQVVVEPGVIDLETAFEASGVVSLTISNDGTELARNVRLDIADQANYNFTPLVASIGDLAAGASVTVPVAYQRVAPPTGEAVDCVPAGSSAVSFVWLRGNTPVLRAFPIAVRLPRIDCPDSRPLYGFLPLNRDGAVPYAPAPRFTEQVVEGLRVKGGEAAESAPAAAATSPAPATVPGPRDKGMLERAVESLVDLLPGMLTRSALAPQLSRVDLQSTDAPQVHADLDALLEWEGITPGVADAGLAGGAPALEASTHISSGRIAVGEPFDITVDLSAFSALSAVKLEFRFIDELELISTPAFEVIDTKLIGLNSITNGSLVAGGVGKVRIHFVPNNAAARTRSKFYRIEPRLTFTADGTAQFIQLLPLRLQVDVRKSTTLQIFTPAQVFGDEPLTPEIEPGQNFDTAVSVLNNGARTLEDVRVRRFEPTIEEIDTGAIDQFQALALRDKTVGTRPGLRARLGSVAPAQREAASWNLIPETSGDMTALLNTITWQVPGQGRAVLLPDVIEQYTLVRSVQLNVGVDDGEPDLLVDNNGDGSPDQVLLSNTNPATVTAGTNVVVTQDAQNPNAFAVTSTMPFFIGYLEIPLPSDADPNLDRVTKSNGANVRAENVWVTRRTIRTEGGGTEKQLIVHVVDVSSNGRYTVFMGAGLVVNEPPVADAGGDQTLFSGQAVNLEGRGSFDPEEKTITYLWEFIERPAGSAATLNNPSAPNPSFTPDARGRYRIQLTVSDGEKTATDVTTIQVGNRGPTARTTGDLQAVTGTTVTLDATGSTDPEGDDLEYNWTVLSQPSGSNVTITNPTSPTPTVTVVLAGTYTFRVSVTDDGVISSVAEQRVTVTNRAPIANAGPDQAVRVNDRVNLDGSNSLDPDGAPLTFAWTFVSVPTGSNAIIQSPGRANATFIVDRQGDYVARLTVSDGISSAIDEVNISTSNRAPIADAGLPKSATVGQSVVLDGTGSFDPDGDNLRFSWTLTERPPGSTAAISDRSAEQPTLNIDLAGNYTAQLVVNDGSLNSAASTVSISTGNTPPVANAGPDQRAAVGAEVVLNGSSSSDADRDQLLYIWSFRSRPAESTAALTSANVVNPRFTIDRAGTYVVELRTFDGRATSAADTVSISTENSAPTANAGLDVSARIGETVRLDGGDSTDPDGDELNYSWSLTSKPTGSTTSLAEFNTATPSLLIDREGEYVLRLLVSDGRLTSEADTVIINTLNSPPTANAGADRSGRVGQTVTLDGSGSRDPDGDELSYTWAFSSVPQGSSTGIGNGNTIAPSFVIDRPGTYVLSLVVNDGTVDSAPDTVIVTTENAPPVANAGADIGAAVGQTVTLDGSASSDPDLGTLTYSWSISSRPAGSTAALVNPTSATPTLTIDEPGDYVAQLIVNDGSTNSTPDTVRISTVNTPPVANAGLDRSALINQTVTLSGAGSTDADGDELSYQWTLLSKPTGSNATLSSNSAEAPTITVDVAGSFVIQLVVSDGLASSTPDTVTISTNNTAPIARAGSNQSVTVGETVQLDGLASSDPDGAALTFTWSFVSRPAGSSAALNNVAAPRPVFTADAAGDYVLQLIVSDGVLSSAAAQVTVTATVEVPVCTAPPAPTGVTATDGAFADRVEVSWNAVPNAVGYRVLRSTTNDAASASPVSGWIPATSFSDTSADAPVVTPASGCGGSASTEFRFFFYFVQARTGTDVDCEGPRSSGDQGHRGTGGGKALATDEIVRVLALPHAVAEDGLRATGPAGSLFLRVTAQWGSVDSIWGEVTDSNGNAGTDVTWLPVPGAESHDGWVVYTPAEPLPIGTRVSFTAGGESSTGAVLGPYSMDFIVEDIAEEEAALAPLADGDDSAFVLLPSAAYETARELAVPVPAGVDPADAGLYYYLDNGNGGEWTPAEQVAGWLAGAARIKEIDGAPHVIAEVTHGGILRVAESSAMQQAPAATVNIPANAGDLAAALVVALVLLGASRRWTSTRQATQKI